MHGGRLIVFFSFYERESYFPDHAFDDDLTNASPFEVRRHLRKASDGKRLCMRPDSE